MGIRPLVDKGSGIVRFELRTSPNLGVYRLSRRRRSKSMMWPRQMWPRHAMPLAFDGAGGDAADEPSAGDEIDHQR